MTGLRPGVGAAGADLKGVGRGWVGCVPGPAPPATGRAAPLPHWSAPRARPQPWLERVRATLQTHLHPDSVWFRNSLRAALALGLAVLLTRVTRVEHRFWVVLGTLSVLRSNALATGRTALLAIAGTAVGFVVAAALTLAIGTSEVALWITLPIVAFLAAYVPTAVSFLVGQAAFTLFVVVLFDLLQPQGWRLGLVRLEDVALGVGVSLVVAVLLWPRGARAHLRSALAALYRADAAGNHVLLAADAMEAMALLGYRRIAGTLAPCW